MNAHDPKRLKTAAHLRFTEDTVEKKLADSQLWQAATALRLRVEGGKVTQCPLNASGSGTGASILTSFTEPA